MNSGIYIRVERQNVLLEDMTSDQRNEWLSELSNEGLIRTVNILCDTIAIMKQTYNIPEEEDDE
jgi:hypothetical protein